MKISHFAATLAGCVGGLVAFGSAGVSLGQDGLGQALIYPYFSVQAAGGRTYNTYLSVVNHTESAKALRVRFREGRNSRQVASFNLFLGPNDAWTGAVIPAATGAAQLISRDTSCTWPPASSLVFSDELYSGANGDSHGAGLERTREGWVEVLEMATLLGDSAAAVSHNGGNPPSGCAAVQQAPLLNVAAPTGGVSGTLTLINVESGLDFTVNAEALDDLVSAPFYRTASDAYPDFGAAEVNPVSIVMSEGRVYRSVWGRGVDAVSAVLMRSVWMGEFVLDAGTRSKSDFVITFPTRHHYVTSTGAFPPFAGNCQFPGETLAGEPVRIRYFNRDSVGGNYRGIVFPGGVDNFRCGSSTVFDFLSAPDPVPSATSVLGSVNRGLIEGAVRVPSQTTPNGWARISMVSGLTSQSSPSSTVLDPISGVTVSGSHVYSGVPVVGFSVRTFENGTLSCGAERCQGNYGGAFPLKYRRAISAP